VNKVTVDENPPGLGSAVMISKLPVHMEEGENAVTIKHSDESVMTECNEG
jgi:hypothetical protein